MAGKKKTEKIVQHVDDYYESPKDYKVWEPCNVYPTAKLGKDVSVGKFSEIGESVSIGDRTRIGMGCFIPENVTVEEDCFIAPGVKFCNDPYPPSSSKDGWLHTLVCRGAVIGMNATILPGVVIGEKAMIAAGSVVTQSVPENELWAGNPAEFKKVSYLTGE